MPLPIIQGVHRVAYSGVLPGGAPWVNVVHFKWKDGLTTPLATDLVALNTSFSRFYQGTALGSGQSYLATCMTNLTLTKCSITPLDGSSLGTDITLNYAGTSGGSNSLPNEVSPCLTLRTNRRGRSYRGRMFLPAPVTTVLFPDGTLLGTMTNFWIQQMNGVIGLLGNPTTPPYWTFGVASYLHSTFEPVTSLTMDKFPDVQRRRKK